MNLSFGLLATIYYFNFSLFVWLLAYRNSKWTIPMWIISTILIFILCGIADSAFLMGG